MSIKKHYLVNYFVIIIIALTIGSINANIPHSGYVQNNTPYPLIAQTKYIQYMRFYSCKTTNHLIEPFKKYSIPTKKGCYPSTLTLTVLHGSQKIPFQKEFIIGPHTKATVYGPNKTNNLNTTYRFFITSERWEQGLWFEWERCTKKDACKENPHVQGSNESIGAYYDEKNQLGYKYDVLVSKNIPTQNKPPKRSPQPR